MTPPPGPQAHAEHMQRALDEWERAKAERLAADADLPDEDLGDADQLPARQRASAEQQEVGQQKRRQDAQESVVATWPSSLRRA